MAYQLFSEAVPLDKTSPREDDIVLSEKLYECIENCELFEDAAGLRNRQVALKSLNDVVRSWVSDVATEKNVDVSGDHGARTVPFGGHLLGIVMKDSDIDVVCLVPDFVQRGDFFSSLPIKLKATKESEVCQLRTVPHARVPILKFCFCGYHIDLSLATLSLHTIPPDVDLMSDTLLERMDLESVRSLSGYRAGIRLLELLPDQLFFRDTLKAVKLWAKRRGLQSSAMRYPSGMGWAIMVAKMCQLYPKAPASTLVGHLFSKFADWDWPRPVLLTVLAKDDPYGLQPWNPLVIPSDKYHMMPVITPSYPEKNAAFGVTRSTLSILRSQLVWGGKTVEKIINEGQPWKNLFEPAPFFDLYSHFLQVVASASTTQDILEWSGFIESRLRLLVEGLGRHNGIRLVHAWPKSVPTRDSEFSCSWFLGLSFEMTNPKELDLSSHINKFQRILVQQAKINKSWRKDTLLEIKHVKRKDLAQVLPPTEAQALPPAESVSLVEKKKKTGPVDFS